MAKGLFVVGTGTDVGKTYVTALLIKALRKAGRQAAYYKAAMSGNLRDGGRPIPGDAVYVRDVSGIEQPLQDMCPYVYERAYSPHLAARIEGNPVELTRAVDGFTALTAQYDYITVEGSGGIVCPLRCDEQEIYLIDVIRALRLPTVLVADAGLGAINAVVLTAAYMRAQNLPVKGVIYNRFVPGDPICEDNIYMCEKLTGLKTLARIETGCYSFPFDPSYLYYSGILELNQQ